MPDEEVEDAPPPRPWYRRIPRWAWALIAAGLLALIIVLWLLLRRPTVMLVRVERGQAISAVYAPGTVISPTETVVASTAAGSLVALNVRRGSTVRPGQIIARVDDTEARNAVAAARADLTTAQAQLPQARADLEAARAQVRTAREQVLVQQQQVEVAREQASVARARVASAQAQLASARDSLRRTQFLYDRGAVPRRDVVEAQTAVRTAEAGVAEAQANAQAAQETVSQAQAGVNVVREQVGEAESGVARAQAAFVQVNSRINAARVAVRRAEDALADYTIRSLVSGTVSEVSVEVGDFVAVGSTIARIVDTASLYIEADVDETDIGQVAVGQTAYFVSDANPDRTYSGRVSEIGASADPATNTYPVEIRNIENPQGLRVQMSVDVNIVTRMNRNALLVPASAVVLEPEPHVWMVDNASRLRYRAVQIGARDTSGQRIELRAGAHEGDLIVRNPQPTFREGQRVNVRR